ncbi:Transient receptor putative cation channel subfamily V member 1 [Mactra antiquata]
MADDHIPKILKCYKILYGIEQGEDNVDAFKHAFDDVPEDYSYLFSHNTVLSKSFDVQMNKKEEPEAVDIRGQTLLFRAISKYETHNFIDEMGSAINTIKDDDTSDMNIKTRDENLKKCIEYMIEKNEILITAPKKGYSPFYLVIVKENKDLIQKMIARLQGENSIVIPEASGSSFGSTVMLAGFPLGVAALTLNKNVFRRVLKVLTKCRWEESIRNGKNDTIVHCLIKYVHYHKEKLDKAQKMLQYILDATTWKAVSTDANDILKQLVMSKNNEQLTPLQLAAKRQQFELFNILIHSKHYHIPSMEDGLTINMQYNITELDTLPACTNQDSKRTEDEHVVTENHFSVLEFVYQQSMPVALSFADCIPVREVIKTKWLHYRLLFYSWFIIHFVVMSLLTWSGIHRSNLMFENVSSKSGYVRNNDRPVPDDKLSLGLSIVGLIYAILFVVFPSGWRYLVSWCCLRRFRARIKANFCQNMWRIISDLPYTNKGFEISFVLFGILLILDLPLSILLHKYENTCLIFALIIGWCCFLFFLQVFERFSMFTVLIQRVIKDMFNFAIVMGFLLIGFTAAMSMLMVGVNNPEDDFGGLHKSLLKMFTVMLGIGEISDIFKARQPVVSVVVFVLFVLLTTILLLNALIAIMSNSCNELTETYGIKKSNKLHAVLQKLSVIVFLESTLPRWCCCQVGTLIDETSERRFISITLEHGDENDDDIGDDDGWNNIVNAVKFISHLWKRRSASKRKQKKNKGRVGVIDERTDVNRTDLNDTARSVTLNGQWVKY